MINKHLCMFSIMPPSNVHNHLMMVCEHDEVLRGSDDVLFFPHCGDVMGAHIKAAATVMDGFKLYFMPVSSKVVVRMSALGFMMCHMLSHIEITVSKSVAFGYSRRFEVTANSILIRSNFFHKL